MSTVSQAKAKEILRDGTAQGHPLTKKQKGFFGAIAGGKRLRKAANGAMMHDEEAAEGGDPLELDTDEANMVVVGDGGSDPAAEEYLLLPRGSAALIAPKLHPDEEPTMSNAMRAMAHMKLKHAAVGMQKTVPIGGLKPPGPGQNMGVAPGSGSGYAEAPKAAKPPAGSTPYPGYPTPSPVVPTVPVPVPVPFDPGVGVEPDMASSVIAQNVAADQSAFGRGARNILGAAGGLIRKKLQFAASGGLLGPGYNTSDPYGIGSYGSQTDPYQQAQLDLAKQQMSSQSGNQSAQLAAQKAAQDAQLEYQRQALQAQQQYWQGGLEQQRYATDAQRAIAQMNIDAQRAANAATLQYQRERLALDRLLGERQAATDEGRLKNDAMQNLMTRAGRQMIAPGGTTIPSMAPLVGRSIM